MQYFDLCPDQNISAWTLAPPQQAYFADGTPLDIWAFVKCETYFGQVPVPFRICSEGIEVDHNDTPFGTPIISERLGNALSGLVGNEIQRIPAQVDAPGNWEVLNVLQCIDCIDHERSVIQYYPDDFSDEARAGKPRGVFKLRIRKDKVQGKHLFRPMGWNVTVIGSELVRRLILDNGFTGIDFQQVT
jgi:hypothetical protein